MLACTACVKLCEQCAKCTKHVQVLKVLVDLDEYPLYCEILEEEELVVVANNFDRHIYIR